MSSTAASTSRDDRAEIAPVDVGADVDPARAFSCLITFGVGAILTLGDVARAARGRLAGVSIEQVLDVVRLSRVAGVLQTFTS